MGTESQRQTAYVLVRTDMPLPAQAVQACHAAHEAGMHYGAPPACHLVLLKVDSEDALLRAATRLEEAGIDHRLIYEPDWPVGHTALATRPLPDHERKRFGKFRLWQS